MRSSPSLSSQGVLLNHENPAIIVEFAAMGNMRSVLRSRNLTLAWADPKLRWCDEVARGLRYMHKAQRFDEDTLSYTMGIVHRDIKTSNILVDAMFVAKITDFVSTRPEDCKRENQSCTNP